jgi:hypothetical protein
MDVRNIIRARLNAWAYEFQPIPRSDNAPISRAPPSSARGPHPGRSIINAIDIHDNLGLSQPPFASVFNPL